MALLATRTIYLLGWFFRAFCRAGRAGRAFSSASSRTMAAWRRDHCSGDFKDLDSSLRAFFSFVFNRRRARATAILTIVEPSFSNIPRQAVVAFFECFPIQEAQQSNRNGTNRSNMYRNDLELEFAGTEQNRNRNESEPE